METSSILSRMLLVVEYMTICVLWLIVSGSSSKLGQYYMPGEQCGYIIDSGDQFKVNSVGNDREEGHRSYPANVSCTITFRTKPDKKFFMLVTKFGIENSRDCQKDGLFLYNGHAAISENMIRSASRNGLCGEPLSLPNYFSSEANEVAVKFVTDATDNDYRGFQLVLTPYWQSDGQTKNCSSSEFTCVKSDKCITIDAKCNNVYNCADGTDEPETCPKSGRATSLQLDRLLHSLVYFVGAISLVSAFRSVSA
ncbi:low-density lipoprotein receptor-related protein 12-like [Diadema antillarum]|uniref:low-density lipoprotein receptor-related protein 12-like n=1 Tax=Diadema antillarum TaxID=105358 RepID=UPI003A89A741